MATTETAAEIVALAPAYVPAVADLQRESMLSGWSQTQWQQVLDERHLCRLAVIKGNVVGAAVFATVLDEAELETIFVASNWRGAGIANSLLAACFKQLDTAVQRYFLEVDTANESAIALYKRFAFAPVSVRKAYYKYTQGNGDALIMQRQI